TQLPAPASGFFRFFSNVGGTESTDRGGPWLADRGRPGPGVAPRLGRPSMAALAAAAHPCAAIRNPRPATAFGLSLSWLRSSEEPLEPGNHWHRSAELTDRVSRALTAGSRVKQDTDVLRASQGRVSTDALRGTAARPCERPARCARPDRAAALTRRPPTGRAPRPSEAWVNSGGTGLATGRRTWSARARLQPGDGGQAPAAAIAPMGEEARRIRDRAQLAAVDVGGLHPGRDQAPPRQRRQVGQPVALARGHEGGSRPRVRPGERLEHIA